MQPKVNSASNWAHNTDDNNITANVIVINLHRLLAHVLQALSNPYYQSNRCNSVCVCVWRHL